LAAALAALAASPAVAIYLWANGLTAGALALCCLVLSVALLVSKRRTVRLTSAALFAISATWGLWRMVRPGGDGLQICDAGACDGRGHFWQRIPDEREGARFGLYVSRLAGIMRGGEARHFDTLLDTEYARLPATWSGLPNALLLLPGQRLEWRPPEHAQKLPCLIFLHGFGGELTPYLHAMVESKLGQQFVIEAPVLDPLGQWWGERGRRVLLRTLDALPPEVDRSRVYLLGLSNGGVAATDFMQDARLRPRFRGFVLISGIGDPHAEARLDGVRVLALSGRNDPRFPFGYVQQSAAALRAAGAEVELVGLDADHFLILTHASEWTDRALQWVGPP
jgi:predicted esterase